MTVSGVTVEPAPAGWEALARRGAAGTLAGEPIGAWSRRARAELGLPAEGPIIATGHQTLLWHPGILAKYLALEAVCGAASGLGRANLVVDQHADDFGTLDLPVRRGDGSLALETLTLTRARPGVPMGHHPAFDPPAVPGDLAPALPTVAEGLERILAAIAAHRDAPNAAGQMAGALEDLMAPWVAPMPRVCASDLMATSLARALVERMVAGPTGCAQAYNDAVAAVPEARIGPLSARELPLWRLGASGRREHATGGDARAWLAGGGPELLPRALFLTALVRLGMCDLFVHGTGGARYDRAMERWLGGWLDLVPAPIAVATATLRLPFEGGGIYPDVTAAAQALRRLRHDPEGTDGAMPGPQKRAFLARIGNAPRRSLQRRRLFDAMHAMLRAGHDERLGDVAEAQRRLEQTRRAVAEAPIRSRRTWAFPLHPAASIDALAAALGATPPPASAPRGGSPGRTRGSTSP